MIVIFRMKYLLLSRVVPAIRSLYRSVYLQSLRRGVRVDLAAQVFMDSKTISRRLPDDLPPDYNITVASEQFEGVCSQLGFTKASEKRKDGTCVEYLGLAIDTVKMEARLPEDRRIRAINEINEVLNLQSVTMKHLEKLLGLLEFCVGVFPLGRPFLRHVWNMFRRGRSWRQRLTMAARQDLQWWKQFLPIWSGISAIQLSRSRFRIATDASGKKGIVVSGSKQVFSICLRRDFPADIDRNISIERNCSQYYTRLLPGQRIGSSHESLFLATTKRLWLVLKNKL
jgi:hypothetical protein